MSTATQPQMSDSSIGRRESPDWAKTHYGRDDRNFQTDETYSDAVELKYRSISNVTSGKLAKSIGLFSIALGLAEVLAPARLGEAIGVSNRYRTFLPVLGAREIAHGLGIMASAKPTTAMWTRVGGDVIDLAYLGAAFMGKDTNKRRLAGATLAVLGVGVLDLICAQRLSSQQWSERDGNPMAPTTVGQPSGRAAAGA
jgi:hypothetical protein